ncbi:MAG TPA: LysM peptidoglycan-binding domain-containing protein [Anaerolineales bacterium]|nr:LysM peptidoglycan-binding domain-containing protein [Anaerolineales bacterium]
MTSNEIPPESPPKDRLVKACPYLGLLMDSQTALAFPSASNVCYHAKPLVSPTPDYQRAFCLNGRQHIQCPVFSRSAMGPLPPEISGRGGSKPVTGKPIQKQVVLPLLLGGLAVILVVAGLLWMFGHFGSTAALPGASGNSTPTATGSASLTAMFAATDIPITPNLPDESATPTDTPVSTSTGTITASATPTPTMIGATAVLVHTQVPCGAPAGWVVYYVQPGDSLYRISVIYGVTVAELQRANCLGSSTTLHTGQTLYVPPWAPIAPTPTLPIVIGSTSTPTATQVVLPPTSTPTEASISTATEVPTEIPTEIPTEVPTEVPTDVPSDTPVSP